MFARPISHAVCCLVVVISLPAISFAQRTSHMTYDSMGPNFQQSRSGSQAQRDGIDQASYMFDDQVSQVGCDNCAGCDLGCGSGCGCCCGSGCGCGGGYGGGSYGDGLYVLYESVIVQPFFTRNAAYYLVDPLPLNDGYREVPFSWDFSYSPRIEFGALVEGGVGARARYWYFDDDTSLTANDPNGDIFSYFAEDSIGDDIGLDNATDAIFTHSLRMHVLDLEAVAQRSNVIYSGGLRYAQMKQLYTGTETAPGSDAFSSGHDFEGWGLTVAAELRKRVHGGISVFAKVRSSFIFGTSDFFAAPENNGSRLENYNNDDLISAGEMQIGLDGRTNLASGSTVFFTLAAEAQYWNNAGTGGPTNNAPFDEGNYQNAQPQDADLGFFGVTTGAGILF